MSVADFVVFLAFWQFLVARSNEFSFPRQVVVGPLTGRGEDECVSKVILSLFFGVGAPGSTRGGRATLWKSKLYDNTMGYPGEDVRTPPETSC